MLFSNTECSMCVSAAWGELEELDLNPKSVCSKVRGLSVTPPPYPNTNP